MSMSQPPQPPQLNASDPLPPVPGAGNSAQNASDGQTAPGPQAGRAARAVPILLNLCLVLFAAHCYRAGTDEVEAAHDCGLSYGKYRAYQELAALDPTVTPEQVADMTMREIRDRIAALSGTAPLQGTQSPAATSNSAAGDTGAQKEPGHHGAGHHGGDD